MIRKLLFTGIFTGVVAGVILSLVQQLDVLPLILDAEIFETQSEIHHQGQPQWQPSDGTERLSYTYMSNIILGIGFSLIMISLMAYTKYSGWRSGVTWGLAGFCVIYLAPSLGLPPELPGAAHSNLEYRQLWWLATVIMTAIGLSFLFFNSNLSFRILGILFIIAPHFFSSQVSSVAISQIPKDLTQSYIIATSIANFIFWISIGALNGILKIQFEVSEDNQKSRV